MERAGALRRIIAYLIDTMVTLLLLIPFWGWYLTGLFSPESGIYLLGYGPLIPIVYGLVQWLYFSLCWSIFARTLGMAAAAVIIGMGDTDGKPGFWRSTLRYLGMMVTMLTFGLGFIPVLFSEGRLSLQDILSKTVINMKT